MAGESGKIIRNVFGKSYKEGESIFKDASKGALDFKSPNENTFYGKKGGKKLDEYQTKEDNTLLVTKVEGPLDNNGKNIDKFKQKEEHWFKATFNRVGTKSELKKLLWQMKIGNVFIPWFFDYSSIKTNTKTIQVKLPCYDMRVYAYFVKPFEKSSVTVSIHKKIFYPYMIAKSRHRKGMNEEGNATHHDMMKKDMTDDQIIKLNPDTKKWIDIVNKEGYKGIVKLAVEMEDLVTDFSQGDLDDVNVELYKKFVGNKGGNYSDKRLTQAAVEHDHTAIFFTRIKDNMKKQLKINPDFVFDKQLLVNHEIFKPPRSDIPSPSYPDKYGGLGISINDTWGYDMKIVSFEQNTAKRTFSAQFEVEIFDHYGLNSEDIDPKIKGGWFGSANFEGFLCWFILQHKCGYKPFYTILNMKHNITNATY